jgi:hypothetical protein
MPLDNSMNLLSLPLHLDLASLAHLSAFWLLGAAACQDAGFGSDILSLLK